MNPSIEVQINARLDQLDAGLKVAEAKINESASKMGNAGDKAGSAFVNKMVGNMVKGLAMGAVTNVLGGGILTAVKGINAGDSGEKIGMDIAQGIVDGAKGIPIVGIFVSIFDEIVNGADRAIEKLQANVGIAVNKYIEAFNKMIAVRESFVKSAKEKTEDVAVLGSPENTARLAKVRQNEKADNEAKAAKELSLQALRELRKSQAAEEKANMAKMENEGISGDQIRAAEGRESRDEEIAKKKIADNSAMKRAEESLARELKEIDAALVATKLANQEELNKKLAELKKNAAKDATDVAEKAKEVEVKRLQKLYDEHVAETIAEEKRVQEEKLQAQQDIIDAEQAAQAQISKVGRVDQMAGEAARGMINSGQTALGQFNFAQEGAAGQAMTLAQKQVASLEKIEAATAEMVRLEKVGGGFR